MNGNTFITLLLRSPLHPLLSGNTLLITVTGRKTGRPVTTPVNYHRDGGTLWVLTRRDRKWWRNLRGGAPVSLRLGGKTVQAYAEALLDPGTLTAQIPGYLRSFPMSARALGLRVQESQPDPEDLQLAAQTWLLVRIEPCK